MVGGDVTADGVQQEQTVIFKDPLDSIKIGTVIFLPDMLEHTYRYNLVELPVDVAIVLELEAHWQADATLLGKFQLFVRDRDADHLDPVAFGGKAGQSTPAAANLQQALSRFEFELAANQVELVVLGVFKIVGMRPVAAGVAHAAVQHSLEHVVADVVVALTDLVGAFFGLQIEQPLPQILCQQAQPGKRL
ncbi:hypothetical protein GALL_293990 [mine drainage metagenome]|uniref:Uncharacterized protein n=1 Tax=mine drainage metagenome TaxID=410659 RepID=A0A1J5R9M8_9ZZZZ